MQKLILVLQAQVQPLRQRTKRKRISRKSSRKYSKSRSRNHQRTIQITTMRTKMLSHRTSKMVRVKPGRSTVCNYPRNSLIDFSLDMRPASRFFRLPAIQQVTLRLTRQFEWLILKLKQLMTYLSHF